MVQNVAEITPHATKVFNDFWPGPLSVILPKRSNVPLNLCAGLDTVAVRAPVHEKFREVLRKIKSPLAAPSANKSNKVSPTQAYHVLQNFKNECPPVLDGGPCKHGLESTVLDLSDDIPIILRPGPISQNEIEKCLNTPVLVKDSTVSTIIEKQKCPGQTLRHYSPQLPLILTDSFRELKSLPLNFDSDIILCFEKDEEDYFKNRNFTTIRLAKDGQSHEIAKNLYHCLQKADSIDKLRILTHKIEMPDALGIAINDRLTRAAS